MDSREFTNKFKEYKGEALLTDEEKLDALFERTLRENIDDHLQTLETAFKYEMDEHNYTVYTGTTGIAYLYYYLYHALDHGRDQRFLLKATDLVSSTLLSLKKSKHKRFSFLCGDAGPYAMGAVLYSELGQPDKAETYTSRLVAMHESVCESSSVPDEVLYGRAGYLFSLLFVKQHLGQESVKNEVIEKVYKAIITSGQTYAQTHQSPCPLMFEWHEKKYLGAAHGLVGILYMLMQVDHPECNKYLESHVRPTVDFLMTLKFPSGNYPSSIGSTGGDTLVHWCHGAPGWIHMFIKAYKIFHDEKYLNAAKECVDVLWKRGLLKKGYGICHGSSGNAYGFLAMYKLTGEMKYLHMALKFGEWCFNYGQHGCRSPDHPYSLFEGIAGTVHFLSDLLDPKAAKFPAFEV